MCSGPLYVDSFSAFQFFRNYNRLPAPSGSFYIVFDFKPTMISEWLKFYVILCLYQSRIFLNKHINKLLLFIDASPYHNLAIAKGFDRNNSIIPSKILAQNPLQMTLGSNRLVLDPHRISNGSSSKYWMNDSIFFFFA